MIVDVIMPKLGESITEGTIIEWKKQIGDDIAQDETILEISTDKVDSEVPSPSAGKLIEVLYNPNDVVAVGEVIARIMSDTQAIRELMTSGTFGIIIDIVFVFSCLVGFINLNQFSGMVIAGAEIVASIVFFLSFAESSSSIFVFACPKMSSFLILYSI